MVANGNIDVYNGVKASPPVTIEVLTRAAARTRSSDVLSDPRTNAAFGKLANEYVRLRSSLIGMIALIRKRANWQDLILKYPTWSQQRDDFQNRIDELSSSGNPSSPYVQVNANLENAAAGLGAAEERAISCDAPNATVDLAAADYYLNAVRSELSTGRANIGDAADSPRFASPSGYCKVTVTTPTTCAVPNGEVKYLGGPTVTMPSGLNPSDRALVLVIVAPNGTVVRASIWKTSGNAQIDQSVLGVARRGKFSPKRADCRPVEGEYLFGAYSAAR
jgi:TonB family protein